MHLPSVSVTEMDGVSVVTLRGEHDLSSVDAVRAGMAGSGTGVVADLSEVTFIDSSILGVLVECSQDSRPFAVAAPPSSSPEVQRLLELTGLAGRLPVHDSLPEAVAAVAGASPSGDPG